MYPYGVDTYKDLKTLKSYYFKRTNLNFEEYIKLVKQLTSPNDEESDKRKEKIKQEREEKMRDPNNRLKYQIYMKNYYNTYYKLIDIYIYMLIIPAGKYVTHVLLGAHRSP